MTKMGYAQNVQDDQVFDFPSLDAENVHHNPGSQLIVTAETRMPPVIPFSGFF